MGSATTSEPTASSSNEVRIVGQVRGEPEVRTLPSGDEVVALRVSVARDRAARRSTRSPLSDVFDVSCFTARTRRTGARLVEGQTVEIAGAMRRRVWRTGSAVSSRMDLEAVSVKPGRRSAGST